MTFNNKNMAIDLKRTSKQVVVSLTSFPKAIPYAMRAIQSILEGTVLPDKVVLYLTVSQFPESQIPQGLQSIMDKNPIFEVRFYEENIRSYTKLIPALIDFPDAIIVTVDDDIRYHKNVLRDLLRLHTQFPNAILAHRAKRIIMNTPYRQWKKYRWYDFITKKFYLRFGNLQTGVGGVLYPPHSLRIEMLDSNLFMNICPTTDDVWFWAAAMANGTKILPVPFGHNKPRELQKPKELSLKTINFKSGIDLNRAAFEKILEKYPVIKQRIESESER
jgi:hypothetical protein